METELASPLALIVATLTSDDVHVAWPVRFSVVPSLKLPVAVKRCELPSGMLGLAGVIVIEVSVASVTVSDAVPTSPANSAVMVASPAVSPVASPLLPLLSPTVATDAGDEVHEADWVRSCELPSAKVPMARNWIDVCAATVAVAGVSCSEVRAEDSTTTSIVPFTEPCCAVMVAVPADWPVT